MASGHTPQLVDVVADAPELSRDRARAAIEDIAEFREFNTARTSLEQLRAKLLLHQAKALAQSWL